MTLSEKQFSTYTVLVTAVLALSGIYFGLISWEMLFATDKSLTASTIGIGSAALSFLCLVMTVGIHTFNVDKLVKASFVIIALFIGLPNLVEVISFVAVSADNGDTDLFVNIVVSVLRLIITMIFLTPILLVCGLKRWSPANN